MATIRLTKSSSLEDLARALGEAGFQKRRGSNHDVWYHAQRRLRITLPRVRSYGGGGRTERNIRSNIIRILKAAGAEVA